MYLHQRARISGLIVLILNIRAKKLEEIDPIISNRITIIIVILRWPSIWLIFRHITKQVCLMVALKVVSNCFLRDTCQFVNSLLVRVLCLTALVDLFLVEDVILELVFQVSFGELTQVVRALAGIIYRRRPTQLYQ